MEKIANIQNGIDSHSQCDTCNIAMFGGDMLHNFWPALAEEAKEINMKTWNQVSDWIGDAVLSKTSHHNAASEEVRTRKGRPSFPF